MKNLWVAICFVLVSLFALAQSGTNEWISYDQGRYYFKVKVTKTGIHRIDQPQFSLALSSIGLSIGSIDPRSIQVFGRGEEIYIHVEGENDASFDAGDFIEFYAQHNDGWADKNLYISPEDHTNPYYSLYNDTAAYFITWNPLGTASNKRFTNIGSSTPSTLLIDYVLKEEVVVYNSVYQKGKDLGSGVAYAPYNGGKGWMSNRYGYNNSSVFSLPLANFSTPFVFSGSGAPPAKLEIAVAGLNTGAGGTNAHHTRASINGNTITDIFYGPFDYDRSIHNVPLNLLGATTSVQLRSSSDISLNGATADQSACAYMKIAYPRTTNLGGASEFSFILPALSTERFFSATNFSTSTTGHLYDLTNHRRYAVTHNTSNGSVSCNIAPGIESQMFLATQNAIKQFAAAEIEPVGGDGTFTNPADWEEEDAYLILSHQKLMVEAQKYALYRNNGYNTVLINIEELYDQFAFGIRKHPGSIRNFVDYALSNWQSPPAYLLLIGKGISETIMRKSSAIAAQSFLPCMGFPVSDVLLTAGLNGLPIHVPAIPTGRIAARTPNEVSLYLSKVNEHELSQNIQFMPYTLGQRLWQKNILHFAGGNDANENARFRSYLSGYQSFVEDSLFAGKVHLFSKTSGNTIEQLNTDSVKLLLKQGAAVITFFGHSSGNTFDLSVDDPTLWENNKRYPLVIANSCYSGNIHLPVSTFASISEQYVFTAGQGSIAFLATPDLSFENGLNTYTRQLYRQFSLTNYGKTLGEQMKATCISMPGDDYNVTIALEMTLHGDPALKLFPHAKSELTINDPLQGEALKLVPSNITSDLDSFAVEVDITNLGRSAGQVFLVTATRTFPDGSTEIQSKEVNGINYNRKVNFTFATKSETGVGANKLEVAVDFPLNVINEFIETENNISGNYSFFVSSSDVFPVYPYNYGVVPSPNVELQASTGFPILPEASYTIQIDTNDAYNGLKLSHTVVQSGGVVSWNPELENYPFEDSTVFFWRITPTADTSKWREFSFQVISGAKGWGQDHFQQFKHNPLDLLQLDPSQRRIDFSESSRLLQVRVLGNPTPSEYDLSKYTLDGQLAPLGEYGIASSSPGLAVVVIDSSDLRPWGTYGIGASGAYENDDKRFGNNNDGAGHRARVEYYFTFNVTSATQMNSMVDMIQNHVEDGHYLLIYTQLRGLFDDPTFWSEQHLDFFENLGADSIRHVGNQNPYIFLVQKGRPDSALQVIGKSPNDLITLTTTITSKFKLGSMESTLIGPAMKWGSFHLKTRSLESIPGDTTLVSIYAQTETGELQTVATLSEAGEADIAQTSVDQYPFLRSTFYTEDNINATPTQLNSWHVLYDPAPEAAINPRRGKRLLSITKLNAGIEVSFGIAFENISSNGFGSFRVHYWYSDLSGNVIEDFWLEYDTMAPAAIIFDSIKINTSNLNGKYTIYMEVNPKDEQWHPEQYHFNNRAFDFFEVISDKKKPLLDVTFDGIHILNGDIVSPTPLIVMELKDENPLLMISDTSSIDVFISKLGGEERRIPFVSRGEEVMQFEPAEGSQNKARIYYQPKESMLDGEYALRVMGRDVAGNMSGQEAYRIEFEIINKSSVTHVFNYPNPFSTSTRFVFTLTGNVIPEVFTIQIMTVTGKVVREITQSELGNIRIGRNVSEYAWDGRDEFGDALANGVYLYRVNIRHNGLDIERRSTEADQYFTKEFGKMYLLR